MNTKSFDNTRDRAGGGASLAPAPAPVPAASIPACLVVEPASVGFKVAALPVLDRLLVALQRAGCGPISVVAQGPLPRLPRATAWRVPFTVVPAVPEQAGPRVWVRSDVLVETGDFRRLLARGGAVRLVARDGTPLPAGVVEGPLVAESGIPEGLPELPAAGVACRVRDREEARRATSALWASITSGSDGYVDRVFNRPVGRPLSRLLVHTPVTPNMISVGATLVGLLAAAMFAVGRPGWALAAAVVFQISAVIDCVDGDVARSVFKETALGKWLDIVGDQVVHLGVFAGITLGLLMGGSGKWVAWLGASAMAGAVLSFLVVLRGWREAKKSGVDGGRMQRILDAATNRDFSVLVLVLAALGELDWFLWLAGVGSHLFWMALLVLQLRMGRSAGGRG